MDKGETVASSVVVHSVQQAEWHEWIVAICVIAVILWLVITVIEYVVSMRSCVSWHELRHPHLYQDTISLDHIDFKNHASRQNFEKRALEGANVMHTKRAVFCGLCRDINGPLKRLIPRIEQTGGLFGDYSVVLFENDSADATREAIHTWASTNHRVYLLGCPEDPHCRLKEKKMYDLGAVSENRIEKMANFRNRYMQHIKNYYTEWDCMIVMDMDIQGAWCMDAIKELFCPEKCDAWDAVFANGRIPLPGNFGFNDMMYDMMAFQEMQENPAQHTKDMEAGGTFGRWWNLHMKFIEVNFWSLKNPQIDESNTLYPVCSGFNGMGIYKIDAIKDCMYSGNLCEHIGLHNEMVTKKHDKLFVDLALYLTVGFQGSPFECQNKCPG